MPSTSSCSDNSWSEHPLFLTHMPTSFDSNPLLSALAALIEETEQAPYAPQRRKHQRSSSCLGTNARPPSSARPLLHPSSLSSTPSYLQSRTSSPAYALPLPAMPLPSVPAVGSHRCMPYAKQDDDVVPSGAATRMGEDGVLRQEEEGAAQEVHRPSAAQFGEMQMCMSMWRL
eukprot:GHVS01021081.1.p1 GENE.GHVS01021081.1~~GHVS01021081.1.p1  ORF type:complete len:186 (+),score=46.31 GHVS01021081.1:42-560(+)